MKKNIPYNPLQVYCSELADLFQQAITKTDPALFLYEGQTRTVLFMAESLVRLLSKVDSRKKFTSALKIFKKLEDLLGEIEDYDHFKKQFFKNRAVKKEELAYLSKKLEKAMHRFNKKLIKKEYFQEIFNRLSSIKFDFNNRALIEDLQKQMLKELSEANDLYQLHAEKFTDFESQVHELRRKLRWISIYAQSLMGIVVLEPEPVAYDWEKSFISKSSLKSPFNAVPLKNGLKKNIVFNKTAFYALNYTIDRLGHIKDKAIAINTLAKAIQKTGPKKTDAAKDAAEQLKVNDDEHDLLKEAHELLGKFFNSYKIHHKLIQDTQL